MIWLLASALHSTCSKWSCPWKWAMEMFPATVFPIPAVNWYQHRGHFFSFLVHVFHLFHWKCPLQYVSHSILLKYWLIDSIVLLASCLYLHISASAIFLEKKRLLGLNFVIVVFAHWFLNTFYSSHTPILVANASETLLSRTQFICVLI